MSARASGVGLVGTMNVLALLGPSNQVSQPSPFLAGTRGRCSRRAFRGEECQVARVRAWVASLIPPSGSRDHAISIATELASNAIRHTASGKGGLFAVEVSQGRDTIRVTVADAGGPSEPHVIEDACAEHGRGLLLVRGLSWQMGMTGGRPGRVIWADIARGGPDAVRHARDLLARTADLAPSASPLQLMRVLSEYRAALHALAVSQYPPT